MLLKNVRIEIFDWKTKGTKRFGLYRASGGEESRVRNSYSDHSSIAQQTVQRKHCTAPKVQQYAVYSALLSSNHFGRRHI